MMNFILFSFSVTIVPDYVSFNFVCVCVCVCMWYVRTETLGTIDFFTSLREHLIFALTGYE